MDEFTFCPLSYADGSSSPKICGKSCAWYNQGMKKCVMYTIAAEIERVRESVSDLRSELLSKNDKEQL